MKSNKKNVDDIKYRVFIYSMIGKQLSQTKSGLLISTIDNS